MFTWQTFIAILIIGLSKEAFATPVDDCLHYSDYIKQALALKESGLPIKTIQQKIKIDDSIDKQLKSFIRFSIGEIENDPRYVKSSLETGVWLTACTSRVK